jgi:hypothetical protein
VGVSEGVGYREYSYGLVVPFRREVYRSGEAFTCGTYVVHAVTKAWILRHDPNHL